MNGILLYLSTWTILNQGIFSRLSVDAMLCDTNRSLKVETKCYIFYNKTLLWKDAKIFCNNRGLHLPRIDNLEAFKQELAANPTILEIQGSTSFFWTGANDQRRKGTFQWDDNEVELENVLATQPKEHEDCVRMNQGHSLEGASCSNADNVVCMDIEPSWFGSHSEFRCNCRSATCNNDGHCLGADKRCKRGWFGDNCQFRDIPLVSTNPLTDSDDATCVTSTPSPQKFQFHNPEYFSWIRIVVKNKGELENFKVEGLSNKDQEIPKRRYFVINERTVDVYGGLDHGTQVIGFTLSWSGTKTLCSVYVFGGENVALKQLAEMSSQDTSKGHFAVDGERGAEAPVVRFSRTDLKQTWTLVLKTKRVIHQLFIFLPFEHTDTMETSSFSVDFLSEDNTSVHTYIKNHSHPSNSTGLLTISPGTTKAIRLLKITLERSDDQSKYMEFSEVEIYGECVPPSFGLDCNLTCSDKCLDRKCHHTRQCYVCAYGRKGPFCEGALTSEKKFVTEVTTTSSLRNESCTKDRVGLRCQYLCHCQEGLCDNNGSCISGVGCSPGWFGLGCQYNDASQRAQVTHPLINDNNDSTCYHPPDNIVSVHLDNPVIFTWITLVFENDDVKNLSVYFLPPFQGSVRKIPCENLRAAHHGKTIGVYCSNELVMNSVHVEWNSTTGICSVHVTEGRNVASEAKLTIYIRNRPREDRKAYTALVIDGKTQNEHCLKMSSNEIHILELKFASRHQIHKIIMYTNQSKDEDYVLQGLFDDTRSVFVYKTKPKHHHILYIAQNKVSLVTEITFLLTTGSISICEIEVFGDCAPPYYNLECSETCNDSCHMKSCDYAGVCLRCADNSIRVACKLSATTVRSPSLEKEEKQNPRSNSSSLLHIFIFFPLIGLVCLNYLCKPSKPKMVLDQPPFPYDVRNDSTRTPSFRSNLSPPHHTRTSRPGSTALE